MGKAEWGGNSGWWWLVFLSCLLFRWGVLHRVLLVVGRCQHLYLSGFLCVSSHYLGFQLSSFPQLCLTLSDPMDCSMPGFPVHHLLPELSQTHVHRVGDAIQPSHPLSSPSPLAISLSQHQGLFQLGDSSHQVAKLLEFYLQPPFFQWIFRTNFI